MSVLSLKSTTQRKGEMLSFGLRHNEVYITLISGFMKAIRVAAQGGMSSLLSYLCTQVDVSFTDTAVKRYHCYASVKLFPGDVEYLLENDLEEVVWHAVETCGVLPLGSGAILVRWRSCWEATV